MSNGTGLRGTRSAANARVTLMTTAGPGTTPSLTESSSSAAGFTTLRRTTRSTTRTPTPSSSGLNLASYSYAASPPKKRARVAKAEQDTKPAKVELEVDLVSIAVDEDPVAVKPEKAAAAARAAAAAAAKVQRGLPTPARSKAHPAPPHWAEQYRLIEKMRAGIDAPVDTMGCSTPRAADLDAKTNRFHILISLMLSSQTKDAVTSQAVLNLHAAVSGGLTAATLAAAAPDTVADAINKVGFWRRKTEYIQEAAKAIAAREDGDVPQTIEELVALRGVGPKMGFLALQAAWDINAGIGVDVHVHRITNRLRWHKPPTKTPEETRINLESWLPPPLHKRINPLLVGFGQVVCLPVGPRCDVCLLAEEKLCPSRAKVNAVGRKEIVFNFVEDGGEAGMLGESLNEGATAKVEIEYEERAPANGDIKLENGGQDVKTEAVLDGVTDESKPNPTIV